VQIDDLAAPVAAGKGLPGRAYTDPAVFEAERERLFRGGWMALLFAHEVPDAGDQMPVDGAGLPLVAVRERDGSVRVFHNVCRHRAALVVPEPVRGQPTLRCPLHGWAYALDGTLRAIPLWDGHRVPARDSLDRASLRLREVRSFVWCDIVWVDLSGTAVAPETLVAPFERLWAPYDMTAFRLFHTSRGKIAANWKLTVETAVENYHEAFVHAELPARVDEAGRATWQDVADEAMFGFTFAGENKLRSETPLVPLHDPGAPRTDNLCFLFPNTQLNLFGGLAVRTMWVPRAPDLTEWCTAWYLVGDAATDPALAANRDATIAFWMRLRGEDQPAVEYLQQGRTSPVATDILLSPFWERSILTFHRMWVERMAPHPGLHVASAG